MIREYYRVVSIEEHPEFYTRSYNLSREGLEDPNCHVVGLSLPPGEIPISLEDGDKIYVVQLWMTHESIRGGMTATVHLEGATNAS